MNFLAIDTSGKRLCVVAYRDGEIFKSDLSDCAMQHSVRLMGEIDGVFARARISVKDCDFFAAVVGAGSFTGIRIGISTVKGLCAVAEKPALAVTSFDALAYAEKDVPLLALVDAGHGCCYACAYNADKSVALAPRYLTAEEAHRIAESGYTPVAAEPFFTGAKLADPCAGLLNAVLAKRGELCPAEALAALYIRKSSAEENAK